MNALVSHLNNHGVDFFVAANGVTQSSQTAQGITNHEERKTSMYHHGFMIIESIRLASHCLPNLSQYLPTATSLIFASIALEGNNFSSFSAVQKFALFPHKDVDIRYGISFQHP